MTIHKFGIYDVKIPFLRPIAHHLRTRVKTRSIIVTIEDDRGNCGVGEGAPREYVTGERIEESLGFAAETLELLRQGHLRHPTEMLARVTAVIGPAGYHRHPAAICAIETAILDLFGKRVSRPIHRILRETQPTCRPLYSGVIPHVETDAQLLNYIHLARQLELKAIKVKVTALEEGLHQLTTVRNALGFEIDLRVDANGAFSARSAIDFIRYAKPLRLSSIEQPVPRGDLTGMQRVAQNSHLPVIADESMYTRKGPYHLIENGICHGLNIRLSSCGGFNRAIDLYRRARQKKMVVLLGAHVGETAVLSLAGRNLAMRCPEHQHLEGSFSKFLLAEDLVREDTTFRHGGVTPVPDGPGLGIRLEKAVLAKWSDVYALCEN
ncbi:MAG: enolase C-terminal domain-like protein [Desulfosarcinaceae bacterium]|nr:enolase C-terminal domain-like protein [Desulfosarcinaceae bacterium]